MKTGKAIVLVLLGLAIVLGLLPLAGAVLYLVTGSLEMNPTAEQQEKTRIAGAVATTVFGLVEALLVGTFIAVIRRSKQTQNNTSELTSGGSST
jgi:flagellar basal body-associated protein FliL